MTRFSIFRSFFIAMSLAGLLTMGSSALAQDASPEATPDGTPVVEGITPGKTFTLLDAEGGAVAYGNVATNEDGSVTITVVTSSDSGLTPGEHGIHLHQVGACTGTESEPFSDAGDHFNPEDAVHGGPETDPHHAGDLGNVTVKDDGSIIYSITLDDVSVEPGAEHSLADADGTALVIHEDPDDLATDPSGNSGTRLACGVLFTPSGDDGGTPVATPSS